MAKGIAKNFNTNVAISTTGIAGPEGGTSDKPVGLVYIGIYINGKTTVNKYILHGNREEIRLRATKNALNDLRLRLLELQRGNKYSFAMDNSRYIVKEHINYKVKSVVDIIIIIEKIKGVE